MESQLEDKKFYVHQHLEIMIIETVSPKVPLNKKGREPKKAGRLCPRWLLVSCIFFPKYLNSTYASVSIFSISRSASTTPRIHKRKRSFNVTDTTPQRGKHPPHSEACPAVPRGTERSSKRETRN